MFKNQMLIAITMTLLLIPIVGYSHEYSGHSDHAEGMSHSEFEDVSHEGVAYEVRKIEMPWPDDGIVRRDCTWESPHEAGGNHVLVCTPRKNIVETKVYTGYHEHKLKAGHSHDEGDNAINTGGPPVPRQPTTPITSLITATSSDEADDTNTDSDNSGGDSDGNTVVNVQEPTAVIATTPTHPVVPQPTPEPIRREPAVRVVEELSNELIISEMMLQDYRRRGKKGNQFTPVPQWIEIHNLSKTLSADIRGWKLQIRSGGDRIKHRTIDIRFAESRRIEPGKSMLIVQTSARHSGDNLDVLSVLNLQQAFSFYRHTDHIRSRDTIFSETHINIRLINPDKERVDEVGNIEWSRYTPENPIALWEMPQNEEDQVRSSLIRRYRYKGSQEPIKGTDRGAWMLASRMITRFNDKLPEVMTYYGHPYDVGTPGYVIEGRLPVELSVFRPQLIDGDVVIQWATESEVNNAGFNILRSLTEKGPFVKINPVLIQGQGTTSERTEYQWKDTTAKPNTAYYYRIEDVSFAGDIQTLKQRHLKGFISPQHKMLTTWGGLKRN